MQFVTAAIAAATADCWLFTDAKIYTVEPDLPGVYVHMHGAKAEDSYSRVKSVYGRMYAFLCIVRAIKVDAADQMASTQSWFQYVGTEKRSYQNARTYRFNCTHAK